MTEPTFIDLVRAAEKMAGLLRKANQKIAVSESASGGLINAALVGVAGASDFYVGGDGCLHLSRKTNFISESTDSPGYEGSDRTVRSLSSRTSECSVRDTWGIGETGATGPQGNPYGDPPGHGWVACVGPVHMVQKLSHWIIRE